MYMATKAQNNQPAGAAADRLTGTKLEIVEAAQRTLQRRGFSGASAREIAGEGNFNQALIFYHFGSVRNLLLAVLDEVSARRMDAYGPSFERAQTVPELMGLIRRTYDEDLEHGYIAVLGEMVAAGVTDAALGPQVAARLEPWIDLVERKLDQLLDGSPFAELAPPRDLAFGLIALYLGVDMLSHLAGNQSRAESLLELAVRGSSVIGAFLTAAPTKDAS
jgi:AcrR family transcriptional regulator